MPTMGPQKNASQGTKVFVTKEEKQENTEKKKSKRKQVERTGTERHEKNENKAQQPASN